MGPRTKLALGVATWVGPLLVGAALATWIVSTPPARPPLGPTAEELTFEQPEERDSSPGDRAGASRERDGRDLPRHGQGRPPDEDRRSDLLRDSTDAAGEPLL